MEDLVKKHYMEIFIDNSVNATYQLFTYSCLRNIDAEQPASKKRIDSEFPR